jgi:hypothetical protein
VRDGESIVFAVNQFVADLKVRGNESAVTEEETRSHHLNLPRMLAHS